MAVRFGYILVAEWKQRAKARKLDWLHVRACYEEIRLVAREYEATVRAARRFAFDAGVRKNDPVFSGHSDYDAIGGFDEVATDAKRIPEGMVPVSISIKPPHWWKGKHYPPLCPTKVMLSMTREEYDRLFDEILAKLDPATIYNELGGNAVLLCYESPNVYCHRRRCAEWMESALGIVIPEMGFERSESLPYAQMPERAAK